MDQTIQEQLPTPAVENTENKKPSGGKAAIFIALTALLIAIAVTFGTAYFGQKTHVRQQELMAEINKLQTQLSQTHVWLDKQTHQLKTTQDELKVFVQNQQQKNNTALIQANELVGAAEFHLTFEHNVNLALQLLEEADRQIATSKNPLLLPLRETFAQDINLLKTIPKVDVAGMVASLGALNLQAEQLPETLHMVAAAEKKADAIAANPQDSVKLTSLLEKLKAFAASVGHALENLVIVSNDSQVAPILLTENQREFIITNIQSQLNLAQWAVVNHDADIYKHSLLQVTHWLQRYFSDKDSVVQNMLQTLEEMQAMTVNPSMPNISHSLEALQKFFMPT
jgi:uroporphyrin-3 C-methyltransferase